MISIHPKDTKNTKLGVKTIKTFVSFAPSWWSFYSFFGCGSAALGLRGEYYFDARKISRASLAIAS